MNFLKLSPLKNLFWEYDLAALQNADHGFIIERVLEKGNWDDLKVLFQNYSTKKINHVINTSNNISSATKNFWIKYFDYSRKS